MKRYTLLILAAMLGMLSIQTASAQQTQDALYIYRNDGGFNGFFFADIDRIEYSKIDTFGVEHDDYVVQEVYALDSVLRIPLNAIDSVTFVTPETIYKKDVVHTTESDLWNYVIGSDSVKMLLLAKNTPTAMIPKVGDKIVTTKSRSFLPGGFYGLVQSVTNGANGITVNCEVPPFTELFDQWVCKAAGSCDNSDEARAYNRSSESALDVTIPIPGSNFLLDLSALENYPFAINKEWSVKGSGSLAFGINHKLRMRLFAAVRLLLGFNYDCTTRLETTSYFDFKVSGEVGGQFDIPLFDGKTGTKYWIPDTPFTIEWEGGLSSSISGKLEFEAHRKYVTSVYSLDQYNDSFYDEERSQSIQSFHTVANETKTSLSGEASITWGPYFGIYACFVDKKIAKTGFRFDLGMKASLKADLKYTDFLLAAFPQTLPAYMLLNPTPLYDHLNRDGSISFGPFFKCDFEAEFANNEKFKYSKTVIDNETLAWLTGIEMGLKFEGGLVPEFKNTNLSFDKDMIPTASVDIRRPAMLYPPVGFAAYYSKSGKQLGKTLWATDMYKEDKMKNYSMKLPKFGGGKEVTVYPTVKLLRLYELLASPYTSYTVPAEMKVTPDLIETIGDATSGKFTVTDNLDHEEDKYERTAKIDFGKAEKPWFEGKWEGNDYVIDISRNTTSEKRTADITITTANKDESVMMEKTVTVKQDAGQDIASLLRIKEIEFDFRCFSQDAKGSVYSHSSWDYRKIIDKDGDEVTEYGVWWDDDHQAEMTITPIESGYTINGTIKKQDGDNSEMSTISFDLGSIAYDKNNNLICHNLKNLKVKNEKNDYGWVTITELELESLPDKDPDLSSKDRPYYSWSEWDYNVKNFLYEQVRGDGTVTQRMTTYNGKKNGMSNYFRLKLTLEPKE